MVLLRVQMWLQHGPHESLLHVEGLAFLSVCSLCFQKHVTKHDALNMVHQFSFAINALSLVKLLESPSVLCATLLQGNLISVNSDLDSLNRDAGFLHYLHSTP